MVADKVLQDSSDRRQWQKIFSAVVHMLHTQQSQLQSLVKERKLLEDRIKMQHDRWLSDVRLLEDQISQMKKDVSLAEMGRLLEAAKSDMVVGLKQREAFLYKLKLERADSDLEDFKLWIDYLAHNCSGNKQMIPEDIKEIDNIKVGGADLDPNSVENTKGEEQNSKILEGEVRKLKRAYERLISKNGSEVSALLSERDFLWNQFKKLEKDYSSLKTTKCLEVDQAKVKIEKLLVSMELLQSSNNEKDDTIAKLNTKLVELESDMDKSNKEISRLSRELELLRRSRNASITPVLNRCNAGSSTQNLESKKVGRGNNIAPVKKESSMSISSDLKDSEKGHKKKSKRRGVEAITISETPRLFSSAFKVPKLKT